MMNKTRNNTSYTRLEDFLQTLFFAVRTSALQDLEALMSETEPSRSRPIGQRERDTLLVIIAALAEVAKGLISPEPSQGSRGDSKLRSA